MLRCAQHDTRGIFLIATQPLEGEEIKPLIQCWLTNSLSDLNATTL
jgi:hypothetical protein